MNITYIIGRILALKIFAVEEEMFMAQKVVIALGGNAILQAKEEATYENQFNNVLQSSKVIAKIVKSGHQVIITHGNGPQVGNILRQNEVAKDVVPALPLDVCSAESQGFIGYMIGQTLRNSLRQIGLDNQIVNILSQAEVSKDDPAFLDPTKPIGKFYSEEKAKRLAEEKGWVVKEDAGRGWRRVVASPKPQSILGFEIIKSLTDTNTIVITAGGGGVPVIKNEFGMYEGIEAVIEKDSSACRLALEVNADTFMILTDVSNVYINYGKPNQEALGSITVEEAKKYVDEGHFSPGSMKPKIEAAIKFAEQGGKAIICSLAQADQALAGNVGTSITK